MDDLKIGSRYVGLLEELVGSLVGFIDTCFVSVRLRGGDNTHTR